jgi:hypothetical protein
MTGVVKKFWLVRDTVTGQPGITLFFENEDGEKVSRCFRLSEEEYCRWVPDTNGPSFVGENRSAGIVFDKSLIPNLKAVR